MQQPQKPVRYYIVTKDDDQAVVHTVPVSVPEARPAARRAGPEAAPLTTEQRTARRVRMARLVHAIRRAQEKG